MPHIHAEPFTNPAVFEFDHEAEIGAFLTGLHYGLDRFHQQIETTTIAPTSLAHGWRVLVRWINGPADLSEGAGSSFGGSTGGTPYEPLDEMGPPVDLGALGPDFGDDE